MTFELLDHFAVDGVPAAFPAAAGFFATVDVTVPAGTCALLSLYGEAQVNPAGTAQDRVITGLEWGAVFSQAQGGGGDFKPYHLCARTGSGGRLGWTYQDGRELTRHVVRTPGTFRWGAYFNGTAPPASVTKALARVRGLILPASTPAAELARLLLLWRGGA